MSRSLVTQSVARSAIRNVIRRDHPTLLADVTGLLDTNKVCTYQRPNGTVYVAFDGPNGEYGSVDFADTVRVYLRLPTLTYESSL